MRSWSLARALFAVLVLAGAGLACSGPEAAAAEAPFRVRHTPPAAKDIIEAVLASGHVQLTDASCKNAGTDRSDATVSAYLSGFLAEMSQPSGGNHIATEQVSASGEAWTVRLMLRHAEGEDVWSWGIEFAIRKRDGSVDAASFRCIGAG